MALFCIWHWQLELLESSFGDFDIQQKSFITYHAPGLSGALFPFLFRNNCMWCLFWISRIVASGTTSKQISSNRIAGRWVMAECFEGFVALIAMATVMLAAPEH